jgi:DNA-binding transcriptional LysR family regulator
MELRHLRYFVTVADEQHVGRAAARLHVSPSPLSRQLRDLEKEVGVPLLERAGRGIRLTDAGVAFAADARAILADVDRAVARAQAAARGDVGHVVIGFVESAVFAGIIPAVVGAFRRRHPRVTLELLPLGNEELRPALRARRVLVTFSVGQPDAGPDARAEVLFSRRVGLAVPRAHPLARRRRLVLRDLDDQPFVGSPRVGRPSLLDTVWARLRAQGARPRVVIESRSTVTRLSLVASGVGVAFVADSVPSTADVVVKRIADLKIEAKGYLSWRPEDEPSPLLLSLRERARAAARERGRLEESAALDQP